MLIYLDNCSTTKPREEVVKVISESMVNYFGNASSLHRLGFESEKKLKEARGYIASFLNVDPSEITFTSGGTESNNLAIQSVVNKSMKRGKHIITTKIEHPSVLNIMKNYEKLGFDITYLNVDRYGFISLEELKEEIRQDTILIAIMHVNNEVGAVQPIWEVGKIIKDKNPNIFFHVDGVQGFGKVDISLKGIDSYSFSGHKIYGPKGIGGLYLNKKHKISPIVYGGNQEGGLRSGTENIPGIIGFGEAVKIMANNFKKEADHVLELKNYFSNKVKDEIDNIRFNTMLNESSSPYILNISFNYVRGEVLLHYLEEKNIFVSTSSACSAKGTEKSHVLVNMGLKNEEIEGAIRFCFSYENTMEDIDYTVKVLKESVEEIRQIIMR